MAMSAARSIALVIALSCPLASGAAQASDAAAIDSVFSSIAADGPGCAVGVYRDGRIAYGKGYGLADLDTRAPITPATLFTLQSVSKQFVAGAVTLLAVEGKLRLDDPVQRYLPELRDFGTPIAVRDLMRHRSGIREAQGVTDVLGDRDANADRTLPSQLAVINRFDRPAFAPNSAYAYSNTEYAILNAVITRVSGLPHPEYIKSRLLDPLGMRASFVRAGDSTESPLSARPYIKAKGAWVRNAPDRSTVVSSVDELRQWDENFYTGTLGGRRWLDLMLDPGTFTTGGRAFYAHGLFVTTYHGLPVVSHSGSGAMQSALVRFPTRHASVAVLCNYRSAPAMVFAVRTADVVLRREFPVQASPERVAPAAFRWSGLYVDTVGIRVVHAAPDSLGRIDDSTYLDQRNLTILHFSRAGGVPRLRMETALTTIDLPSFAPWTPTAEALKEYAGRYANDLFGSTHELSVANGALMLKRGSRDAQPLEPVFKDAFTADGLLVIFRRDANGGVAGLSYRSERASRLDYRRVP